MISNIPFKGLDSNWSLARALPDSSAWVVRDGFVVKEEDDADVYVFQDGDWRWISSIAAFEWGGYDWGDVHIAPDGYINQSLIGEPIHVLLKCEGSPHIYRIEGTEKRWIRDLDTFVAEGHAWEDVRIAGCDELRRMPDGETIPPGSGPPPAP